MSKTVNRHSGIFLPLGIMQTEKTKSGSFFHWALDGEPANEVQPESAENNQDPF